MFPIDLPALFLDEIRGSQRPNDGLLHASSDLTGSLRHSQLRLADAPTNDRELVDEIRLEHGTLWHEWFHKTLIKHGVPFFHEVPLKDFMPEGWSGTADWVFWHPQYKAFVLGDLKTARGEAMYWIERDGAKKEHIWQLSAYFYALLKMGLPMVKGFAVMYWPMNNVSGEVILPTVQECDPIPEEEVIHRMEVRWYKARKYVEEFGKGYSAKNPSDFINEYLAPPMEREQKLYWSKQYKSFEVKLMPHWTSKFCPYDNELCDCSQQGTTKIGQWVRLNHDGIPCEHWTYEARKGYEEIEPTVQPSKSEQLKRAKEADG